MRKPCGKPGCLKLVDGKVKYCTQHTSAMYKQADIKRGGKDLFYDSGDWRRCRKIKLYLNPVCEICNQQAATEVDHIVPRKSGGADFELNNLQSLCKSCHSRKTISEKIRASK